MRIMKAATRMLAVVAGLTAPSSPALAKPRVISYAGGTVTVEGVRGHESVVVKGKSKGRSKDPSFVTESVCDSRAGTYDELSSFFKKLKAAAKSGHAAQVVPLLRFPFRGNGPTVKMYADAAELTAHYAEVFTPSVLKRLAAAEAAVVYCSGGGGMLGDGVVWAHTENGFTAADIVNP
jgi:hypothetical protein